MQWALRSIMLVNGIQLAPIDSISFPTFEVCHAALAERGAETFHYFERLETVGISLESLTMCSSPEELRRSGHRPTDTSPELTRLWPTSWAPSPSRASPPVRVPQTLARTQAI